MNKKAAILYVGICIDTYRAKVEGHDFTLTARFENKGTDTQGLFGTVFGDTSVIAFRGSEETGTADWVINLKFIQTRFPYGGGDAKTKVHYGFLEAYQSVRDAVLNEARNTAHKKIVFTGHSLGGALATLAALDIQHSLPDKEVTAYTYGSPKAGDQSFVTLYNKTVQNTFRFVNGADGVPKLPPGDHYHHVDKLYQIGDVRTSLEASVKDALIETVDDHFPTSYLKVLQALP